MTHNPEGISMDMHGNLDYDNERPCPRCHGFGEVVVASHDLGDGVFNDDFDICPACDGSGTGEGPRQMTCEVCWNLAYIRSRFHGGHQVDHYYDLLRENDGDPAHLTPPESELSATDVEKEGDNASRRQTPCS